MIKMTDTQQIPANMNLEDRTHGTGTDPMHPPKDGAHAEHKEEKHPIHPLSSILGMFDYIGTVARNMFYEIPYSFGNALRNYTSSTHKPSKTQEHKEEPAH